MEDMNMILWVAFGVTALLFWWVGASFISQPDYNIPRIFQIPLIGKMLVLLPQIGFLAIAILGFVLTDSGWWFLGAVVAAITVLSSRPQGM